MKKKLAGSGGGGEDEAQSTVESPDTLVARQYLHILDLISEGEVEGPVSNLQSVFIDDTPVMNADGTKNVSGVTVDWRSGTQTQTYIPGIDSVESEHAVSVEVKKNFPITRTIESQNTDAVRISLGFPTLQLIDEGTGSSYPTSVKVKIEVQNNGGGYVAYPIGYRLLTGSASSAKQSISDYFQQVNNLQVTMLKDSPKAGICIQWIGSTQEGLQWVNYEVFRAIKGTGNWVTLGIARFEDSVKISEVVHGTPPNYGYIERVLTAPTRSYFFYVENQVVQYDYKLVINSMSSNTVAPKLNASLFEAYTRDYIDELVGKCTSKYVKNYKIKLEGAGPFDIRVSRITDDSATRYLQNATTWESYTEIIDKKFTYPNSAYVALSVDAKQYSNIPARSYHVRGIKCRVPSNYDPVSRTYTGLWNFLTWKVAYTDNPAWIFYDLCTNKRYGLGNYVSESQINIATLYTVAKYCDGMVPDGYGGTEPRYTCSLYIQGEVEAYRVLNDIASVFGGMVYWADGGLAATCDMPSNHVWTFTNANVKDGEFVYSGSSKSTRNTVALVTYVDKTDRYNEKVEYVEDTEGISKWGVKTTKVVATGATSRGQAHRLGKNILLSGRYLTNTVTFTTGLEAAQAVMIPGSVFNVMDKNVTGDRVAGRVISATTSSITLDAPVTLAAGTSYQVTCILPDGSLQEALVTSLAGTYNTIEVMTMPVAPSNMCIWMLVSSEIQPRKFRVISVQEKNGVEYEVTGLEYNQTKYAAIEQNLKFAPTRTSAVSTHILKTPTSLGLTEELYIDGNGILTSRVLANIQIENDPYVIGYKVKYKDSENVWRTLPDSQSNLVYLQPVKEGMVEVEVQSYTNTAVSPKLVGSINVLGKNVPPSDVDGFSASILNGMAYLTWNPSTKNVDMDVTHYVIRHSSTGGNDWNTANLLVPKVSYPQSSIVVPALKGSYLIKAVDSAGNYSINSVSTDGSYGDINSYNVVLNIDYHPYWAGTKTHLQASGGLLYITGTSMHYWQPLHIADPLRNFGANATGDYVTEVVDVGDILSSRVTTTLQAYGSIATAYMSGWNSLTELGSMTGADPAAWSVDVYSRTKQVDTDPWGEWSSLVVGEMKFRYIQFKLVLTSKDGFTAPFVSGFSVSIDVEDRVAGAKDVVCPVNGMHISFGTSFSATPAVVITGHELDVGDTFKITNKTRSGFDIVFTMNGGSSIERTFDWIAKGYGFIKE